MEVRCNFCGCEAFQGRARFWKAPPKDSLPNGWEASPMGLICPRCKNSDDPIPWQKYFPEDIRWAQWYKMDRASKINALQVRKLPKCPARQRFGKNSGIGHFGYCPSIADFVDCEKKAIDDDLQEWRQKAIFIEYYLNPLDLIHNAPHAKDIVYTAVEAKIFLYLIENDIRCSPMEFKRRLENAKPKAWSEFKRDPANERILDLINLGFFEHE